MLKYIRYHLLIFFAFSACSWGFYAHKIINKHAVFLLPPELSTFFLFHIHQIEKRSVYADKRRYIDPKEACKHYIDLDLYGDDPFIMLPKSWYDAKDKYSEDTLLNRGILPWVIYWEYINLVEAMDSGTIQDVIRHASDLGHYVADACVPLHTTSNYDGQHTKQDGIHSLWETKIPESIEKEEFFIAKSQYLDQPLEFSWNLIQESFFLVDSTLRLEKELTDSYREDGKYIAVSNNGIIQRQYTQNFIKDYNSILDRMVDRRMNRSIFAIASFWYTAWIESGQPDLMKLPSAVQINLDSIKTKIIPQRIHE